MSDEKITALAAGTPKPTDIFIAVDTTDTSMAPTGTDKMYTRAQNDANVIDSITLVGDVTGPVNSTSIANSVVTNAKMANMNSNTIKANLTGSPAAPQDVTLASLKTALNIDGSVTISVNQIGFGNSSNNLIGSSDLTWNQSAKTLNLSAGSQIIFANSITPKIISLYNTAANNYQFYGFGIASGQLKYHTDSTFSDHVFYAGTSSSSETEVARIKGNGNVITAGIISAGGGIILPTTGGVTGTLDYYEKNKSITLVLSGPWGATTVTLPVTFTRIGNSVTMKWGASSSNPITTSSATITSGQSALSVYIPTNFVPSSPANAFWFCPVVVGGSGVVGSFFFTPNAFGTFMTFTTGINSPFSSGSTAGILPGSISYLV